MRYYCFLSVCLNNIYVNREAVCVCYCGLICVEPLLYENLHICRVKATVCLRLPMKPWQGGSLGAAEGRGGGGGSVPPASLTLRGKAKRSTLNAGFC